MHTLPLSLYRTAQIKTLEQRASYEYRISGFELMTRAGAAVFDCLKNRWPNARNVTVVCGGGNNAGDGYLVAYLARNAGLNVKVYALINPDWLKGDALTAYRQYLEHNGEVIIYQPDSAIAGDIIVDAIFGTGLDRPIGGLHQTAIAAINAGKAKVLAVDIPSGLSADTGQILGCGVKADCTVTFIGLKQGLFTGYAADYCGDIRYAALGLPDALLKTEPPSALRITGQAWPRRARSAHKGDHGHVLVIGGDAGYSGAARLAGKAALRVGAGLVSIATRSAHAALLNIDRPELMCHGVESAEQLEPLLTKADVVVLGPGLGQSDWAKTLFGAAIAINKPLIVDADGLNLLAKLPDQKHNWILTPHPGEAARLLATSTATVQQDRFAAAEALQSRYGGIVILKGAGTLVASETDVAVATTGNPGMAGGGMGDVLAGLIAGLVAQGMSLNDAARQGVHIHGLAADLAAAKDGERGLLANDLMPYLRRLVNRGASATQ